MKLGKRNTRHYFTFTSAPFENKQHDSRYNGLQQRHEKPGLKVTSNEFRSAAAETKLSEVDGLKT